MTAVDPYKNLARTRAGGPSNLARVTPDDTQDLSHVSQWVFLETAGTLRVTTAKGQTVTTPVLPSGWHLMELSRIHATDTTATGLMVGW